MYHTAAQYTYGDAHDGEKPAAWFRGKNMTRGGQTGADACLQQRFSYGSRLIIQLAYRVSQLAPRLPCGFAPFSSHAAIRYAVRVPTSSRCARCSTCLPSRMQLFMPAAATAVGFAFLIMPFLDHWMVHGYSAPHTHTPPPPTVYPWLCCCR